MAVDLSKYRVPLGSLIVDMSMVVTLIWWGATITERLEQLSKRIDGIDGSTTQVAADKRIAVVEARQNEVDRRLLDLKDQNSRIETKVDRLLEREGRRRP